MWPSLLTNLNTADTHQYGQTRLDLDRLQKRELAVKYLHNEAHMWCHFYFPKLVFALFPTIELLHPTSQDIEQRVQQRSQLCKYKLLYKFIICKPH